MAYNRKGSWQGFSGWRKGHEKRRELVFQLAKKKKIHDVDFWYSFYGRADKKLNFHML